MLPRDGVAGFQQDTSEGAASSWKDFRGLACERESPCKANT